MFDISKKNGLELINFIRESDDNTLLEILKSNEKILEMNLNQLNILFLNLSDKYKMKLLDDYLLFDKIMSIPINRMKKSIIDLSSDEIRNYIYNSKNLVNSSNGKKLVRLSLEKLDYEELTLILDNNNLKNIFSIDVLDYVNNNFKIDENLRMLLTNSITLNKFNSLALFKIKNETELLIYTKFNILVNTSKFTYEVNVSYEFIRDVNKKHILSLIDLLKNKEEINDNNKLFITVMKLYMVFGIDNSKKIINDFFTFSTKASLKRVSYELFKENRREFRLKNQNKFYYHNMESDFLNALYDGDLEFFRNFCLDTSDSYILNLINNTKDELLYLSDLEKLSKVKIIIDNEINKRESYYKEVDTNKFYKYFDENKRENKLSIDDLYSVFSNVDVEYILNKDGKLIVDKELNEFLLGNYKKDNDCLIRMVFNKHAFGLNRELYNIINNFSKIKKVVSKNKELSLNSISDVIDISKVFLYDLKPNEMDITLETLSKLLNSRKYCTEEPKEIIRRALKLHIKRKEKCASAIPNIKGVYEDVKYKLVDFDSEDLLSCGISSGSCFKVGGKGEDFFEFCLTNPKGLVFYIEYNGEVYVVPATVNGNMLNINSIDPIINEEDVNTFNKIINTIKQISKEIIDNDNNKIEMVTMTDIHLNKFLDNSDYEKIYFKEFIPLNTDCYCDYNKKDVTNYIIMKKDDKTCANYFDNNDLFLVERSIPYIFSTNHEDDKERIDIMINSIAYTSIDYLNLSLENKEKEKDYYVNKEIDDYIYIVGNKDWFIGIRKDKKIDKYLLPYDKRAYEEFNKYLSLIENSLVDNSIKKR